MLPNLPWMMWSLQQIVRRPPDKQDTLEFM